MIWIGALTLATFVLVIAAAAVITMFMGRGHLDAHDSESQHLDEVETFYHNFH